MHRAHKAGPPRSSRLIRASSGTPPRHAPQAPSCTMTGSNLIAGSVSEYSIRCRWSRSRLARSSPAATSFSSRRASTLVEMRSGLCASSAV
jgi:hypothetical protein